MPVGILRITQGPQTTTDELIETIRQAIPSVEIQSAEGEVAILTLTLPEERADEGAALLLISPAAVAMANCIPESKTLHGHHQESLHSQRTR